LIKRSFLHYCTGSEKAVCRTIGYTRGVSAVHSQFLQTRTNCTQHRRLLTTLPALDRKGQERISGPFGSIVVVVVREKEMYNCSLAGTWQGMAP